MTPLRGDDGDLARLALTVGKGVTLPDGKGSIQLDGWVRWVQLQVSDTPGVTLSLAAIGLAVTGLCLSLFVRPRRIWVRMRESEDGRRVVEVGGLDRADARAGLGEDVAELATELVGEEDKVGAA
jgi:cytochrome c biogenesis protein